MITSPHTIMEEMEHARLAERKAAKDPWVRLARLSLETYACTGQRLHTLPDGLPREMTDKTAGAFVSLHAHGQLRGCIGTTAPTTTNVVWEIMQNHLPTPVDWIYLLVDAVHTWLTHVYTGNC